MQHRLFAFLDSNSFMRMVLHRCPVSFALAGRLGIHKLWGDGVATQKVNQNVVNTLIVL